MGKKNRKVRAAAPAPPEAKARPRFPWWAAWGACLLWSGWVLTGYYGRFWFGFGSLPELLSPSQYFGSLLSVLPSHLFNLSAAALFLFACFAPGRLLLRLGGFSFRSLLEEVVFSAGAGFGLLSVLMLALGLAGWVYPWAVAAVLAAGLAAGVLDLWKNRPAFPPAQPEPLGPLDRAAALLLFLALALGLAGAMSPEIFYDALIYHLAVPNYYVVEHGITKMPFNAFSNLPLTHGMIYMAALSVGGTPLAKLVNFASYALTAAAALAFGARFLSRRAGVWGAMIFASAFHSLVAAWSSGTEMPLALFTALALHSVVARGLSGEKRWFVLAGVFCGLSMGVKYTGLFTAAACGAALLYYSRTDLKGAAKELLWFSAAASFFIIPWLAKNWLHTANPFHPMLNGLFPPNEGSAPEKLKLFVQESRQMGQLSLRDWFTAPWRETMGMVGNSELFSPLFLAFLPVLFLLTPAAGPAQAGLWIFFLSLWLTWSVSSTMVRFLIPAYPAAGLLMGWAFFSRGHEGLKLALKITALLVCFTALYWTALVFHGQGRWQPVAGKMTADEYLFDTRPSYPGSHYSGIKYVNENLPPSSKTLVVGDGRTLYFKRRFMAGTAFDRNPLVEFARTSADGAALYARLRAEGITHLLVNAAEGARLQREYGLFDFDARSLAVFRDFWNSHVRELYAYEEMRDGRPANRVSVLELAPSLAPGERAPRNLVADIAAAEGAR